MFQPRKSKIKNLLDFYT